jgi:hypothetical protein
MEAYKFVVLTNPAPGREEEFNAWYDGRHLNDVLRVPGFVAAQRLEHAGLGRDSPAQYKYLTIYDIESDDIATTFETFFATVGTERMPISDGLVREASPIVYRVLGPQVQRPTQQSAPE